jgi:hypothetical protein
MGTVVRGGADARATIAKLSGIERKVEKEEGKVMLKVFEPCRESLRNA